MTRRRFLKLLGLGLVPLSGFSLSSCRRVADSGTMSGRGALSEELFLIHDGQQRSYRIYAPTPPPQTSSPAVLLLHGHGGSTEQLLGRNGQQAPYRLWMTIADSEGLILIIPNGLVGSDGKQGWNDARGVATNPDSDDVDFLSTLVERVAGVTPIDVNRVHAVGTSNGGHMALRLAAEAPDTFAAIAAIAASNPDPIFPHTPQRPISVLLMNGTDDRMLPYEGGEMIRGRGRVQSTDESIRYWVAHNECDENPTVTQFHDRSITDGSTVSRTTYRNPATNVEVALVQIRGGGHTEPSIQQPYSRLFLAVVGSQNQDLEMADVVWDFFRGKSVAAGSGSESG